MELVIFIGLPASGKSSFYRERFAASHLHVSKDLLGNNRRKDRRQRELIQEAFAHGRSVVLDNTHPERADRKSWLALGKEHSALVKGFYFSSLVSECLLRNEQREGPVPEVAIFSIAKKLEPPSWEEGYDELYYVKLTDQGFQVEEWDETR